MTGLVLAYFSRNSSMVIVPSLISMLQGPGLATISLGYVLQPPAHNISAYNYIIYKKYLSTAYLQRNKVSCHQLDEVLLTQMLTIIIML